MTFGAMRRILTTCVILILILFLELDSYLHPEIVTLEKVGSQWASEDGKISFTVYRELWFWDVDEIEENRYIAFGTMATDDGTLDISCICYNDSMSMNLFGPSCDYKNAGDKIMADFEIKASDENEFIAVVCELSSDIGQKYFNDGDSIGFVQTNDVNDIDVSDYEFYVDAYDILNSANDGSDIHIFKTIDEVIAFRNTK